MFVDIQSYAVTVLNAIIKENTIMANSLYFSLRISIVYFRIKSYQRRNNNSIGKFLYSQQSTIFYNFPPRIWFRLGIAWILYIASAGREEARTRILYPHGGRREKVGSGCLVCINNNIQ